MKIQEAQNAASWDEFVMKHEKANYQHLYGWKTSLEKTYGLKTLYLELIDNEQIVGIFPLAIDGLNWFSPMAVSLSLCNYVGPLATSRETEDSLLRQTVSFIKKNYPRVKGIEIREIDSSAELQEKDLVTMIMDLRENSNDLWNSFSNKTRNQIRKALKNNFIVKQSKEHFDAFYEIYARNLHRHGTPVHSKFLLKNIMNEMAQYSELITVWHGDSPVAGMLLFKLNRTLSSCVSCSLPKYNSQCVGNLIYWEAMQLGIKERLKYFDFGRSEVNSPTYYFKKHWGSKPLVIKYRYIFFDKNKAIAIGKKYSGRLAIVFSKCWKIIPYKISLWLGPKIRKRLA